jgi:ubiquinone/menaquinone biosynthesis C-methylase UbiE
LRLTGEEEMASHPVNNLDLPLFRCPACLGTFTHPWPCENCGNEYRTTLGIPDLRWPRPHNPVQSSAVIDNLLKTYDTASFDELSRIRQYRPVSNPDLAGHLRQYRLKQIERGEKMTQMFQNRIARHFHLEKRDLALDIGCGVGATTVTHSLNFRLVLGIDWNLANLILLRKILDEHDISNIVLLQANLLNLPLAEGVCDYVTALNVIEHMLNTGRGFEEIARVLRPGGIFCGDSRNRFDILFPEPHVRLRMLGFLPRRFAVRYARLRRNANYEGTRLLAAHFKDYHIVYPEVSAYGASPKFDAWIHFLETRLALPSGLLLPFFTTMVAIGK